MFRSRRLTHVSGLAAAALSVVALTGTVSAQHSDIDFEYHDGQIEVEFGLEGQVFEGDFPTSGLFEQNTDDPGFATHDPIGPGDVIDYNILGPLEYHNGTSFATVPTGAQIRITDNPSSAGDLIVNSSTVGPVSGPGAIAQADGGGGIHAHIDFNLEPLGLDSDDYGAYALLMELTTDASGIANSDPFYIVFNFGLEEEPFETAVAAFAAKIPEPTTLAIAGIGGLALLARRRASRA